MNPVMEKTEMAEAPEQATSSYLRPVWARKWIIAVVVAIATLGTFEYANREPRAYGASARLFIGDSSSILSGGTSSGNSDRQLADLASLVSSPQVAARAAAALPGGQLGSVTAAPESGSDFIDLSSVAASPGLAAASADAFAQAFISFQKVQAQRQVAVALGELESQLGGLKDPTQSVQLQDEISQLKLQQAQPPTTIQLVAPAVANPVPLAPKPKQDAIYALALSLMLMIAVSYGLDRLDRRIRSEEELEPIYNVPVLAQIQSVSQPTPVVDDVPRADPDQWESFRSLRTNLELANGSRPLRTILIASAQPAEGKSLVVRNLALAYAEAGARVAVVDGDLRRSRLADLLGVESEPGLADVLRQPELLSKATKRVEHVTTPLPASPYSDDLAADDVTIGVLTAQETEGELHVLPAGVGLESRAAAVSSAGIQTVLARMTEEYDVVLVDSAPLLAVSDSVPLIGAVDAVIMVARVGNTTVQAGHRVTELVSRVPHARVIGVVANDVPRQAMRYGPGPYSY